MDTQQAPKKLSNLEKRKPKNPVKFKIELNEEQKTAKATIYDHTVTLLKGMAGSGKTLVACQAALDMFFKREIEKIVITRPTVAKEEIGFLPGDMKEKMDPWLAPIYANLYMLYNKEAVDKMIAEGYIEIVPFAFMRGRTFPNTYVIVDECQNITHGQTEMMLGRLGKNGKMVFCGDLAQIDLKSKKDSGISFFIRLEEQVKGVKIVTLKTNHRHEIVEDILTVYSEYRDIQ
jgi:phosphate starvation-inducible protein PhoH and related proteins